jgi:hypothetical protein
MTVNLQYLQTGLSLVLLALILENDQGECMQK